MGTVGENKIGQIQLTPVGRLQPNDYNPNQMTDSELAEFAEEVRHLGRLPKPVVVRPSDDGQYVIVDGEHAWKAAQQAGLTETPCELVEVDDFEAMRQTYKRNQHGTHNKVLLAKMFKRMGQERGLSLRKLAKEIDVSEGTIRNTIEYLKAVKVRNSYAPDNDSEAEIAGLSMRQVHLFNRLPETLGNMWLDSGADMKALLSGYEKMKARAKKLCYSCSTEEEYFRDLGEYYEGSGLLQYIKPVHNPEQFSRALERVKKWVTWEQKYFGHNLDTKWYTREEFRKYARYYYEGIWPFDNDIRWMEYALNMVIKDDDEQVCLRITPEEFGAVINQVTEYCREECKGLSVNMFQDYFNLAVYEKTGERVEATKDVSVRDRFMQAEIDREAPDYIRESNLAVVASKYALWKIMGDLEDENDEDKTHIEQIARELAKQKFVPRDKDCVMNKSDCELELKYGNDVKLKEEKWAVWSYIRKLLVIRKDEEHRDTAGNIELAMEVTDFVYNRAESPEAHKKMSVLLSQLQQVELKRLHEEITYCQMVRRLRAI